jgi:hypothetical protein
MNAPAPSSSLAPPMSRFMLIVVCTALLLPVLTGSGMFLLGWRPAQTANHGVLIEPPRLVTGDPAWLGKWSLVLVSDAPCGTVCAERLDALRRVRVALAKDMGRTRHVWVGAGIEAEARQLTATTPDLRTVSGRPPAFAQLPSGSVAIVDPQGMAMMAYVPDAPINGLRSDLERLLKLSWME